MVEVSENQSETFDIGGELTVHRLAYGAMRLTGEDIIGRPDDEAEAREVLQRAVEMNVDFVDTADSYGPGVSERIIREAIDPDDAVVGTKAGLLRNKSGDWIPHGGPDYFRNQVLCSLDRLGVDSIDLYQLHTPDVDCSFEDAVNTFAELKDDGLVEHVGLSNVSVEQLDQAREMVEVATVQNEYNVGNRDHEDVLEACEENDIGFISYFPIGGGELGEKESVLEDVAENHDATARQVALAWLLQHSPVTIPIPGTSTVDHLEQNVAASAVELDDEEMNRLSE
ncbi:aldo/keto reductase [Halorussus lipolyticus]|uniref:aldo/keto reductase n=1 Tax=Halorussus lipolyticus TaxID=3034024 RepID=UPI0023E771EA|nr:aldo/keto reductase [Halorussus sp. DT80]